MLGGMLKIKITTAPEKGKANKDIIDFLAKKLGVKKQSVTITTGTSNPVKQICVTDITARDIRERLEV